MKLHLSEDAKTVLLFAIGIVLLFIDYATGGKIDSSWVGMLSILYGMWRLL